MSLQALHSFKTGRTPIMLATDVAATGTSIGVQAVFTPFLSNQIHWGSGVWLCVVVSVAAAAAAAASFVEDAVKERA